MSAIQLVKKQDKTVIQVATSLVDSVTHLLFSQISRGSLIVDQDEKPLQVDRLAKNTNLNQQQTSLLKGNKSKIKLQMESIDIDEHKKLMKKFISQNKKFKRNRQMRSVEFSERSIKIQQEESNQKQTERSKAIEERRKSIEKRLQAKKNFLKQIQKSTLQSNSAISKIQRKKFLYQQKEEEYYKKVILPKIQKQKEILQEKKSLMRTPMDMNEILEHQKSYEALRVNSKVNRSLTISVIKNQNLEYHPPEFVPQSYKKLQEQEQNQKLEDQIKKKQIEVNQIRKKQFLRKVDELRDLETELKKSKQKQKPESPKKQQKLKAKIQLNRQEAKLVGNQYLRELLSSNRKFAKKLKPLSNTQIQNPSTPRQHKSEYEIQIIKEERIQRVHKIRSKKINQLMHDKNLDQYTRHEKLKYQINKLDDEAEKKFMKGDDIETINESALIMMNAIEAKMALLGVQTRRNSSK